MVVGADGRKALVLVDVVGNKETVVHGEVVFAR